jgi:hypothetical protein
MNEQKDRLDRAIDLVANRMVSVSESDRMLDTIVADLPERSETSWLTGFRWQLAGGAIALLAVDTIVRHEGSTRPFDPVVPIARVEPPSRTSVPNDRTNDRAERSDRTIVPNDRAERTSRTFVANDFDEKYGLLPVNAPAVIAFTSITVEDALSVPASELAPLVLTDLPVLDDSSRD